MRFEPTIIDTAIQEFHEAEPIASRSPQRDCCRRGDAWHRGLARRGVAAADDSLAPAADLLGKVRAFLSGLEPDKRKAASFAWNGSEWRGWNYFGATGYSNRACGSSR